MNFNLHLLLLAAVFFSLSSCSYENVKLVDNGYEGVVIAINPNVPEDQRIIESLQKIWSDASKSLYIATKERTYFREITILVPTTWTSGSYGKAGKVSYDKADVLIADAHPGYGNEPYTLQFGLCGGHGEYIHLTPDYVMNDTHVESWGPKGKVMVHEWAHLRWGVFDESGGDGYPEFYINKDGEVEANKCPAGLKGEMVHVTENENGETEWSDCDRDDQTFLPIEGECHFFPKENQDNVTASLMSLQYLDYVVHFCHDDQSDPANMHNKDAPNEHNKLCSQRSVWDVVTSTDDFQGLKPASVGNLEPTFNVVQQKESSQFVLVIDTSGSMASDNLNGDETKMTNAIQAADAFIKTYASEGSNVAIVDFDSSARMNSDLYKLSSDSHRSYLSSFLPTEGDANGGTEISEGVDEAISILERSGQAEGSQIMCLTDGIGSWYDPTAQSVKDKGIIFNSVFFGVAEGNDFLTDLADETGGAWTFANSLVELKDFFEKISHDESGKTEGKNLQIKSESISLSGGDYTGKVSIDSTIGTNTVFSFSYSGAYAPYIDLVDPLGKLYCSANHFPAGCTQQLGVVDETYKSITFKIPGVAEVGAWIYKVQAYSSTTITASVSSMASDPNVEPISFKSSMSSSSADTATPIILYAQVTQGFKPVLNADVSALVTFPDGTSTTVKLLDGGASPDTRKNDGVYSRYFTEYKTTGRYSMKVQVSGKGSSSTARKTGMSAAYKYGVVADDGTLKLNSNYYGSSEVLATVDAEDIDDFERTESLGGFEYDGPEISEASDLFEPSRVLDFAANQIDVNDVTKGIGLQFTAPGDDFDVGQASRYELRYTYNDTSSLHNNFKLEREILAENMINGDLSSPLSAGNVENFTVVINDLPSSENIVKIGFALRAIDEAGNAADVSNVAILDFFMVPPKKLLNPCIGDNDEIFAGQYFPVPGDCSKFYQCDSLGTANLMNCSDDLVFNPTKSTCDYSKYVPGCEDLTSSAVVNQCEGLHGDFVFDEENCIGYQCSHGTPYEVVCPPGLVFNPAIHVCDWPSNVDECH